jgi:ribosome-interacting GTPase 1
MPANLSPAYYSAEDRYRQAVTPEEKLAALEEMLREIPKHKGTEKLQASLKSKISKLRREPRKPATSHGPSHHIPREGAGQVALVGPPNSGKSALVAFSTHASPEVAEYPFTTREAVPGMMPFEDIAFQLIDLPPICDEHVEPWVYDSIRTADLVWLVLAVESSIDGLELVERLLAEKAIELVPWDGESPSDSGRPGWNRKRTLMVLTGSDRSSAREALELVEDLLSRPWPWTAVSAQTGEGLETLGRRTFEALEIIRVYSKQPGK